MCWEKVQWLQIRVKHQRCSAWMCAQWYLLVSMLWGLYLFPNKPLHGNRYTRSPCFGHHGNPNRKLYSELITIWTEWNLTLRSYTRVSVKPSSQQAKKTTPPSRDDVWFALTPVVCPRRVGCEAAPLNCLSEGQGIWDEPRSSEML